MDTALDWYGQQLAEFLAAVTAYRDEASAVAGGVELAALAVEAEIGTFVRAGRLESCIGFRRGQVPADLLLRLAACPPQDAVELEGCGSCYVVAMALDSDPAGTLLVGRTGEAFTPRERSLLRDMARILGLALQPLRQLEVERSLRERSEQQARENQRLLEVVQQRQLFLERSNRVQRAISHRMPIASVFTSIAEGVAEVLAYEVVVLRLLDSTDPSSSVVVASTGLPADVVAEVHRRPVTEGISGEAVREAGLVVAPDYTLLPTRRWELDAAGIASAMAAPVFRDGHVAGSLVVATRRRHDPSDFDKGVLSAFAEHVSVALNDASALDAMRSAYRDAVHQARHDPLTGLPNRTLVIERLDEALQRRRQRSDRDVTVVFIDLDRFKSVNDSFGHGVGDEVLIRIADRLRAAAAPADTVGRLSGDEFVVICEELTAEEATARTGQLAAAVAEPFSLYGRATILTASIGLSRADGTRAAADVLREADVAMYRAKERGRSRIERFDAAMHARTLERLETEQALRQALARDELLVHYQPVVDVRSGRIQALEALVRWERPEQGLVRPDVFIPIAEEAGLIIPIGRWVLREACRDLAAFRALGGDHADLLLNVNLSARQLGDPQLVTNVREALAAAGLPPTALALEITESVLMEDAEGTSAILQELSGMGVRLSIDDFGTGYSSLLYLKRFTVSELKIDRSFVDGLGRDAEDDAIVRAVIGLAHALRLHVVAEGVETRAQLVDLWRLGCDRVQGFLLSRPQPTAAILQLLTTGRPLVSPGRDGRVDDWSLESWPAWA